jgi:hypothetical protein
MNLHFLRDSLSREESRQPHLSNLKEKQEYNLWVISFSSVKELISAGEVLKQEGIEVGIEKYERE